MTPGDSTRPSPSTVRCASSSMRPPPDAETATIRPSRTPTSPVAAGAPVPSTTLAPRISRSSIRVLLGQFGVLQHVVDRVFDDGTGEELGVLAGVEAHRVGEDELTEIGLAEEVVLDHLVHLAEHVGHHRHV